MLLIFLSAIVLLLAAVVGVARLRNPWLPGKPGRTPGRLSMLRGLREQAATLPVPRQSAHHLPREGAGGGWWATRPDLQPAQVLDFSPTKMLTDNWLPGLAVVALATGLVGYPQQDLYYVQRNIIALARGLSAAAIGQRAAALTLSAVMTSPIGRTGDAEEALRESVKSANGLVRWVSRREPAHSDMATTLDVVFAAFDDGKRSLHFAHVGNSSIWLQRAASTSVDLLTDSHAIDGGPLLRAVGLSANLVPDIGQVPVDDGDWIFLTTASRHFAFTPRIMDAVVGAHRGSPLHECVAALANAVKSSAAPEGVSIVAAEVARRDSFVA